MSNTNNVDLLESVDTEKTVGDFLDRPFIQLAIGIVVVLMLLFLALKAGFSLWVLQKLNLSERLVNESGEPDFWTISRTLEVYKNAQVPGMKTDAANKKERFGNRREHLDIATPKQAADAVDDARLVALL